MHCLRRISVDILGSTNGWIQACLQSLSSLIIAMSLVGSVHADPDDQWVSGGILNGMNGAVMATTRGPDGSVYFAGNFSTVDDLVSNRIAKWDVSTQTWMALGTGLNGTVQALTTGLDGSIYVAGSFNTAGGISASRIAKWDPSTQSWETLGTGLNNTVLALTTGADGSIYAAGQFTNAGGIGASHIAKWDPLTQSWEALGAGLNHHQVEALTLGADGSIYVAGYFTAAGGISTNRIAKWDPSTQSWEALGAGLNSDVRALTTGTDGSIYAGGSFTTAGGISASKIAKWDPSTLSWEALGTGLNTTVQALTSGVNGSIYVAGFFTDAGGISANRIAKWDPSTLSWEALGTGLNNSAQALTIGTDGSIYAAGGFTTAGGINARYIAKWDVTDAEWQHLGLDLNTAFNLNINALTRGLDGSIYSVGQYTIVGELSANRIAKFDPSTQTWAALGTGLNSAGLALTTGSDGSIYAAGHFNTAGGLSANKIAKWDPSTQTWAALGTGLNGPAIALTTGLDGSIYVAGSFTTAGGISVSRVAKWDPSTQTWAALGTGFDNAVFALTTGLDGSIYAAGLFTTVGGTSANKIARWDPSTQTWTTLGLGLDNYVWALTTGLDGSIYAAGQFTTAGGASANRIAKWDPSTQSWEPLGTGLNSNVQELTTGLDGSIYATGNFTTAGGLSANYVAKWNPSLQSWAALGTGINGTALALATGLDGSIYVGGWFAVAGGKVSNYFARWVTPTNSAPIPNAGPDQTIEATSASGALITLDASASTDDDGDDLSYSWSGPFGIESRINVDVNLPLGTTIVSLEVSDGTDSRSDTIDITVIDSTAPAITPPGNVSTEATGSITPLTAPQLGTAIAIDAVDGTFNAMTDNNGPFAVGDTTITWTAIDTAGNTGTATQTVTITDSQAPTVTAPADISAEATAATTAVDLGTATATDIVDGELTLSADNVGPYPVGTTTITWSATDSVGNTGTAIQTVTITDNVLPVVTPPANISSDATGALTSIDIGTASATDTVDGMLTATADNSGPFTVGITTVIWSVADSAGNTGTAAQTITISDNASPTVTAPANVASEATGTNTAVDLGTASVTDIVDGTLTATADYPGPYPVGITTITWSASDSAGNTGTATQIVTITDSGSPMVTAPVNVSDEATGATTSVDLGSASAIDTVDGSLTAIANNTGPYSVGVTTITWTATDSAGNQGTATQTVTIIDSGAPVVTAPANISSEATGAATSVTLGSASAIDSVDGTLTATADKSGPYPVGTTTITWSATDSSGNTGTATQTVAITDTGSPILTAPMNVALEATGATTSASLGSATATDAVNGALTAIPDNTGPYPVGLTTVTWSATDAAGNTGSATQNVLITDSGSPIVTAPANITIEANGVSTAVSLGTASASDIVDGAITASPNSPGPYPVGITTVIWSATDSAGNTGTATQSVSVKDTSAPVITAPVSISAIATGVTTSISLGIANANDAVDGMLLVTPDNIGPYPVGTTIIIWSATDAAGNTGTDTQTVTLSDSGSPVVTVPPDVTSEATGAATSVDLGIASAIDDVDGALTATPDNTGPFHVGTTTIAWSATDGAGNIGTAAQTVIITDSESPQIIAPDSVSTSAAGATTSVSLGIASATDTVDGVITATPDNPGPYHVGTTTVTWSASDSAGNKSTATQTVTVTDSTSPAVTAPANIFAEASGASSVISLGRASAIDNVDGTLTVLPDKTGPFPVGTTTIIWRATDSSGGVGTATQTVTILDSSSPSVTAPASIAAAATGAATSVNLGDATANDIVDGMLIATPDRPGPFAVGTNSVIWSATDSAGNTGTAVQTVSITDRRAPVVTAPPSITTEAKGAMTSVDLGTASTTDTVDGILNATANNTDLFPLGQTSVTWSATDSAGNTGSATQVVTIRDSRSPVVTAPANVTAEATSIKTSIVIEGGFATDVVDGSLGALPDNPGPFPVGNTTVLWRATDNAGNTGLAAHTVTITDSLPPTVNAPANVTAEATGSTTSVILGHATATDVVDGQLLASTGDLGPYPVGTTTVKWSATDRAGNVGSASQTVTITESDIRQESDIESKESNNRFLGAVTLIDSSFLMILVLYFRRRHGTLLS